MNNQLRVLKYVQKAPEFPYDLHLYSRENNHSFTSRYEIRKILSLKQHQNSLGISLLKMSCGCVKEVDQIRSQCACSESMIVDGRSCLCGIQESIVKIEEDHAKGYCLGIKGVGRRRRVRPPELERYNSPGLARKGKSSREY
jgi:hypothetical protein